MSTSFQQISRITLPFVVILMFMSACQGEGHRSPENLSEQSLNIDKEEKEKQNNQQEERTTPYQQPQNEPEAPNKIQISNSSENKINNSKENSNKQQKIFPEDELDPSQDSLSLLGLKIHDTITTVVMKYGMANERFVIDDQSVPITVYEYDHFSIGFDHRNKLEFIEIHSSDIDPKLNGLILGDSIHEARDALGEPATFSSFVLSYRSTEAILKLDIDPNHETIISIKLFAAR